MWKCCCNEAYPFVIKWRHFAEDMGALRLMEGIPEKPMLGVKMDDKQIVKSFYSDA